MKTIKKISYLIIGAFMLLYNSSFSQTTYNTSPVLFPFPSHDVLYGQTGIMAIMGGAYPTSGPLTAIGVNTETPAYMLDVVCDPYASTNFDINVGCSSCFPQDPVGYRIGGNMFLWHNGDITNVLCGVHTGTLGGSNTYVGSYAGNGTTTGDNVGIGPNSLTGNTGGQNIGVGQGCVSGGATGSDNTGVGLFALAFGAGSDNTALGCAALNRTTAAYNTATGYFAGYFITGGTYNTADGYDALFGGTGCTGNYNSSTGTYSLYNLSTGNENSALGYQAGMSATTDIDDLFLGAEADRYTNPVQNAAAIGYDAITVNNNQFEIGNNNVTTTLGMSTYAPTGVTRLELNTQYGAAPFVVTYTVTSPVAPFPATGWSGLRFDDLTAGSTPGSNPGGGVLALNGNGDVIYVTSSGGGGTGIGYCATPCGSGSGLTFMTGSGGYNLNNHNLYFAGNNSGSLTGNNVAIGNSCCYAPKAKLDILQASNVLFPSAQSSIGLYVENDDLQLNSNSTNTGSPAIGIKSYIPNPNGNCVGIAGWFQVDGLVTSCIPGLNAALIVPNNGGAVAFGTTTPRFSTQLTVDGEIYDSGWAAVNNPSGGDAFDVYSTSSLPGNTGIMSIATNAGLNIGTETWGYGGTSSKNYGVWGEAWGSTNTNGNIGVYGTCIGSQPVSWAGYFDGAVYSTVGYYPSDSILKTNVDTISNAISLLMKITPYSYKFSQNNRYRAFNFDTSSHFGFISEKIQRVIPNLVTSATNPPLYDTGRHIIDSAVTFKALNYTEFIPLLLKGIQEQQHTIDSLHNTLDSVRSLFLKYLPCIKSLCNQDGAPAPRNNGGNGNIGDTPTSSGANIQNVTLSTSMGAPLLYQNIPNPFSTGTKINYYLPEGTMGASIIFYDSYGNQIKTVALSQTGNGTLNVTPDNLSNGIYSYSLIVNGSVIDTKRMMLQK